MIAGRIDDFLMQASIPGLEHRDIRRRFAAVKTFLERCEIVGRRARRRQFAGLWHDHQTNIHDFRRARAQDLHDQNVAAFLCGRNFRDKRAAANVTRDFS